MDWPGAQEMAKRFKKILDPKVLEEGDQSPEIMAAKQQIEALSQELNRVSDIMENIQDSAEQQKISIDKYKAEVQAYEAETKRISAVQNSMTPEQIQDIVMGTIAGALDTGDLIGGSPEMREVPQMEEQPEESHAMPDGQMMPNSEMPMEMPEQAPEGMMS
jgi:hypothetical protein